MSRTISSSRLKLIASLFPLVLLACSDTTEPVPTGISKAIQTGRPALLQNGYYYSDGDGQHCGDGTHAVAVFDSTALYLPDCEWSRAKEVTWSQIDFHPGDMTLIGLKGQSRVFEWARWSKPGEETQSNRVLLVCRFRAPVGQRAGSSEFTRVQATIRMQSDALGKHWEISLAHERKDNSSGKVFLHKTISQRASVMAGKGQRFAFWTDNYEKVLRMAAQQDGSWKGSLVWTTPGAKAAGLVFKDGACQPSS